jgi:uncharacterized caspase-like protein
MESHSENIFLISKAFVGKPNLYALAIGINEYRNKSITLNYAVSDATAFAASLKKAASPLFAKTDIRVLSTKEATTKEAIVGAFEELRLKVKPNDLFVFYNASHGLVEEAGDDAQYYLLTSNVLHMRNIARDAISQKELAALIGNISAQKKLVILDTCNAGKAARKFKRRSCNRRAGLRITRP